MAPENIIHTPPWREFHLARTPPPPWIFHIYKELVTPTPLEFPQSKTKPLQPLWKSLFSRKNIIKVKNDAVCSYAVVNFILFY